MSETKNEPNQDGLENLPENQRKETQEILDEIGKDGKPSEADGDKPAPKPEEKPKEEEKKEDKPDAKPEEKKPDKSDRRPVKLIPAHVHYTARDQWQKKEKELSDEIARLSSSKPPAKADDTGDDKSKSDTVDQEVENLKKKWEEKGYDPELIGDLVSHARKNQGTLPAEISEKLADIDRIKSEREAEVEEVHFNSDFDKIVLPLIKAEYGDDVPSQVIADVKEDLKGMAYDEKYAEVNYDVLYKGHDQFRGVIPPKKHGAEGSRGGTETDASVSGDKIDLTQPQSDDVIKKMTDADFDTYSTNMQKREKS